MEIGSKLKEARETKGISLDTLQETTKIQKRYLIAIEEGNFNILPGKFYARAFIKEYAVAVGLDANELLESYKDELPNQAEEETTQYTRIQRSRRDSNPQKNSALFSIIPTIIVVILIIGILFAAWWFISERAPSDDNGEPETEDNVINRPDQNDTSQPGDVEDDPEDENASGDETDNNSDDETAEEPDNETTELELVETGTGSKPEHTVNVKQSGEEVVLEFETDGETWLDVKNEAGHSYYGAVFTSNDSPMELKIDDAEKIYLNIGSTPGLKVTVNGTELAYPSEATVQRFWLVIQKENNE
ncbi:helix-turn-helix domain-containing protein [Ornithinibacillus gellani]|uniref:helix-turn-helix domain-containing protein n=1 Tax=Ornithinibacillus gellani TaxID=2293253 RepID=UPI000F48C013|nr:helix-turn-helix domain-containing protein [Ornithinibacillus gellani]TQS75492.1 helix-turn-helix domain-containing protein [Ornithinibacillus gellani]